MAGSEVLLTYKRKRFRSARCAIDSASVAVNRLGESTAENNVESCTDVSELDPEEKRLCSGMVNLQPSLSSPKVIKEEDKSNDVHESDRMTCDPSEVQDESLVEGRSEKASRLCSGIVNLQPSLSSPKVIKEEDTSNPVHESDRMTCDPSEVQDESLVEGRSEKASCDPVSLLDEGVTNTIKGGCPQKSDKMCLEGTVVTAEGMPVDMVPKNKLNLPMKTFCRRPKQKRHSETLENDSTLPVTGDCLLTTGDCKSTDTLSACEATASKICSVNALENPCIPKMNLTVEPAFTQSQEKKAAAEVESSCGASCSPFENGRSSKPVDVTLGNTSGVVQSHGTVFSQNSGLPFSSLQAKNGVDFQETPSAKGDGSKKAIKQEVQGEPTIGSSLPSINGNLNHPIPPVPNKDHDSALLHPKLENSNPNSANQVNHCSSAGAIGEKAIPINFAPAFNHTCLQLFPENVSDQRNYWQEARAHAVSEERPINLHQIRTQARTATPVSSRYLGLPMEPRLKNLACNPGLSLRQSLGMQLPGFIPETKLQYPPDQMPSFSRHQTILDQIASRANSLKGIRSSHLEKKDNSPTLWSEEELDSLWIGVRRYERGNWDAMLRDPRLHFMPWRAPTELAVQWEKEQLKLLNHITFRNQRQSNALNVFRDSSGSYIHPRTGKQISADEVRLSLGDVYSEPRELLLKRLSYLSAQKDGRKQVQDSVADLNSMYLSLAKQRRAMLEMHAAAQGVNSGFPHWLKEVNVPPRTNDTALRAFLSTVNHGGIRRVNQLGVNSSGEPISAPSTFNQLSNGVTVVQNSNATQPSNCQGEPSVDEAERLKDNPPNKEEEVITINSDASSEETVSDDQSGRP